MLNENELLQAKDRLIEQLEENAKLMRELINTQREHLARLSYEQHRFETARSEPVRFLAWIFLRDIWPFSLFWNKVCR
ncbi:MAG: hypothetical protein WCF22_00560 [Candidatus Sulfotelmatobacter sp.]